MNRPRDLAVQVCSLILVLAAAWVPARAQHAPAGRPGHPGLLHDWSSHHVAYTGLTEQNVAAQAERDPRVWMSWLKHAAGQGPGAPVVRHRRERSKKRLHVDWNASLGSATAALPAGAMAAKFSFDLNAVPSCANDYVAYGLNVAGSATQANIIAFNNLYSSGILGGGGLCDGANSGQPTVRFAFNAGSTAVAGSISLSQDGSKLAFVGNPGGIATFYVLTWGTGGGTATVPLTPDAGCVTSCLKSVTLGAVADTTSTPYIDYANDAAYVGDDSGKIWKIVGVFKGTPAKATADPNWPASGSFQTGTGGPLRSPVAALGKVYVTDAAGSLHVITPAASPTEVLATLDATGAAGQASDGPIVSISGVSGTIFAFGQDRLSTPIVLQTDAGGAVLQRVSLLGDGSEPTWDGSFDNTYFNDPTTGFLYVCASNSNSQGGSVPVGAILYRIPFQSSTTMATTVDTSSNGSIAVSKQLNAPCSPLTEIFNSNTVAHPDTLFVQLGDNCDIAGNGCVHSYNLSGAAIASANSVTESSVTAGPSSSITVDNISTAAQASSIYISVPGSAIKLTQSQLQ
jgi:hypothetical protein